MPTESEPRGTNSYVTILRSSASLAASDFRLSVGVRLRRLLSPCCVRMVITAAQLQSGHRQHSDLSNPARHSRDRHRARTMEELLIAPRLDCVAAAALLRQLRFNAESRKVALASAVRDANWPSIAEAAEKLQPSTAVRKWCAWQLKVRHGRVSIAGAYAVLRSLWRAASGRRTSSERVPASRVNSYVVYLI